MEGIKEELKIGELRREDLRKSLEQASAQASSVLLFTLQWKELENHFDLVQKNIEKRVEAVELQEKELETAMRVLGERQEEIGLKEKESKSLDKKIEELNTELKLKQDQIDLMKKLYEECSSEFKSKQEGLDLVRKLVEGCSKELSLKKEQLCSVQKLIGECCEKLERKEKQLALVEEQIEKSNDEIDVKKKKSDLLQLLVEECGGKLELKERELELVTRRVDECCNELCLKDTNELESRKQHLEAIQKSQAQLSDLLESKEKQLDLVEKACSDREQEAIEKKEHLSSLKSSVEEHLKELITEKKQLKTRVNEFELKEKQFDSVQKAVDQPSKELELKDKQPTNALRSEVKSENPGTLFGITNTVTVNPITPIQIKTEQPEHFMVSNANETSSTDLGVGTAMDGRSLLCIPNEHLDEPDLRENEVLATLQISQDPAKFVLDLMQGQQKKGGIGFEEIVLKIYVIMLEQLLQVSPLVQPNVKADALKLAIEWKAKMKLSAENSTEIMVFLQFVAAFGLVSSFNKDEIFELLGNAAQHQQARNVCRALGFTDIIPDFIGSLVERKHYIEAVKFVCAFDSKDKCPRELILNLFSEDINRVARDSCKMGKNSPEVQKAADEQIAALKSVIECIKDCKLEASMPVKVIEECIAELETQKMNRRSSAAASVPAVHSKVQGRKNCNNGPSVPRYQPGRVPAVQRQFQGGIPASSLGTRLQGLSNKRARTDRPVMNLCTPQVATANHRHYQSASGHGFDVPLNQGAAYSGLPGRRGQWSNLGTRQFSVAAEKYFSHFRPRQL